jgi:putative RecB family exonuclease
MSTALLGFETIEERRDSFDGYISASRLNLWLKCPLAWKLRYIEGIRTPTSPSLFLGKVVHTGLEGYYRHLQLGTRLPASEVVIKMLEQWAPLIDQEDMRFDSSDHDWATRRSSRIQRPSCGLHRR